MKDFDFQDIEEDKKEGKYISKFLKNKYIDGEIEINLEPVKKGENYIYSESIEDVIKTKHDEKQALEIHSWIIEKGFDVDRTAECVKGIVEYIKYKDYKDSVDIIILMFEFYCLDYNIAIRFVPQRIKTDIIKHLKNNHFYKPNIKPLEL